jgi:NTE family protein
VKRALVLGGGGVRGAYEAGVLLYLADHLKTPFPFQILCGSSVGSIHTAFLAGNARENWQKGVQSLVHYWTSFELGDVFRLRRGLFKILLGKEQKSFAFLDFDLIRKIVLRAIPWKHISSSLGEGKISALAVTATQIATGKATVFYQGGKEIPDLQYKNDPRILPIRTTIGPKHVLASSAIPFVFPPVRIGNFLYTDGSLRMNVPLSPALRFGADRVLVVCMRPPMEVREREISQEEMEREFGTLTFLLAKTVDALLVDPLERDIENLRMINAILSSLGSEGKETLNIHATAYRGFPYRIVEPLKICPSQSLVHLVEKALKRRQTLPLWLRLWLKKGPSWSRSKLEILSFFFFDREYIHLLIELGYEDTKTLQKEVENFFSPHPDR